MSRCSSGSGWRGTARLCLAGGLLAATAPVWADPVTPAEDPGEAWLKQHLAARHAALRAGRDGAARSDPRVDLAHVELRLTPSLSAASLAGSARLCLASRVDNLADIRLDLRDELAVSAVEGAQSFTHQDHVLTCVLPAVLDSGEQACLTVHYSGNPQSTGFGSYQYALHAGQPIVCTLSEPSGASSWWPTVEDPSDKADSADVYITAPAGFTATSNGTLREVDETPQGRVWHWAERHPISPYLICMSVTNYVAIEESYTALDGRVMPVVHYVYPEHQAIAATDLSVTVPMIQWFAATFGEYPFVDEKYGHSVFTWGGAMEHQCNTSYGATLIRGDHSYDYIVSHELAHQWWGDKITCAAWEDIWLNEGFATYSEALYKEHLGGRPALLAHMTTRCAVNDPSGPIYDPPSTFDGNTVYRKGAWLLHMLRGQLGDSAFFQLLRDWAAGPHAFGAAHVADFLQLAAGYTPRDLDGLWAGFLYGRNRPQYRTDWRARSVGGVPLAELRVQQIQAENPFDLWLPWSLEAGGTHETWLRNSRRLQGHLVVCAATPTAVTLDPANWLLESHNSANLSGQLRMLALRVLLPGGLEPAAGSLRARCGTAAGTGEWRDGLERGIVAFELGESAPDWQPGDSLHIQVEAVQGGAALELALIPTAADWQELGSWTLPLAPAPELAIGMEGGLPRLEWTALPGASRYRVESATQPWNGEWTVLGETAATHWSVEMPPAGRACLRVVAVYE